MDDVCALKEHEMNSFRLKAAFRLRNNEFYTLFGVFLCFGNTPNVFKTQRFVNNCDFTLCGGVFPSFRKLN
jgi:hypothetical protein